MIEAPVLPSVSVLVPVYNAEAWLPACLDSILQQTVTDFELVLVPNGCTDGSGAVCDAYAARDPRIRVRHLPEAGSSRARNCALSEVRSPYVCFIDGDDWVEPDYLETLLVLARTPGTDLGVCGITLEYPDRQEFFSCPPGQLRFTPEFTETFLELNRKFLIYGPCNKVFSTAILRDHGVRFDPERPYNQDLAFNCDYLRHVACIHVSERTLYHYRQANPASQSRTYNPAYFEESMRMYEVLQAQFEATGMASPVARTMLSTRSFWAVSDSLAQLSHPDCGLTLAQKYRQIRTILAHPGLEETLATADTTGCPRIVLASIRRRSALGYLLFHLSAALKARLR